MGVNSRMAATARSRGTSEDASLPKQGAVSHCLLSLPSFAPAQERAQPLLGPGALSALSGRPERGKLRLKV